LDASKQAQINDFDEQNTNVYLERTLILNIDQQGITEQELLLSSKDWGFFGGGWVLAG